MTHEVFSQEIEKRWFDKNDSVYGYYVVIKPFTPKYKEH